MYSLVIVLKTELNQAQEVAQPQCNEAGKSKSFWVPRQVSNGFVTKAVKATDNTRNVECLFTEIKKQTHQCNSFIPMK
jgi:hypothetical protein